MRKRLVGIFVCLLLISSGILPITSSIEKEKNQPLTIQFGEIFYVGGSGPNNYTCIQDAISYADSYDTVYVYDDSSPYHENININKPLSLIGENRYTTQINGSGEDGTSVIYINANEVTIKGFDIENSGVGTTSPDSGIFLKNSANSRIVNNFITFNHLGICLWSSVGFTTISDNIIVNNNKNPPDWQGGYGIRVHTSENNNISYNLISNNNYNIGLVGASNNIIYKNKLISTTTHSGIWAQYSDNNIIIYNNISNNCNRGIDLYNCSNNNISWNYIDDNGEDDGSQGDDGIFIRVSSHHNVVRGNYIGKHWDFGLRIPDGCNHNVVVYNDFVNNYGKGASIGYFNFPVNNNMLYHNNFINNTFDAEDNGNGDNYWDYGYPSGGNYWDDYLGPDEDGDGIGDMPYNISGSANNNDLYPLMDPWNIPPLSPRNPSPINGEDDVSINTLLKWKGGDRHPGDTATYDIYLGTSSNPIKVKGNHSSTAYDPGQLGLTTTYYWKIVAWDKYNASVEGPLWEFTTNNVDNNRPYAPSDPDPGDEEVNVSIEGYLDWSGGDPDDDTVTYDVYFGKEYWYHKVLSNHTETYYNLSQLEFKKEFYWQIVAWDENGDLSTGPKWSFITRGNEGPYYPSDPEPLDGATDVDINADLSWSCSDPNGDDVTYDVYFEANDHSPDELVSNNQSEETYEPGTMNYSTRYFWKIVAWDEFGYCTEGPVWEFKTGYEPNNPPYPPVNLYPENGSTDIDIESDFSWTCDDPDPEDTLVYDVFLEANDPSPDNKIADDIPENIFDPGSLDYDTVYYWRIIAKDNHGAAVRSAVWYFTTESAPEADLYCIGSLSWMNVKPGDTVEGSFIVENIGDSSSLLNWEVESFPSWGKWMFDSEYGVDLSPEDGAVVVNVSVVTPDEQNKNFTGEIMVVNVDNNLDFSFIEVFLTTPKNKAFSSLVDILMWLFERFPNVFPILRYNLGLT